MWSENQPGENRRRRPLPALGAPFQAYRASSSGLSARHDQLPADRRDAAAAPSGTQCTKHRTLSVFRPPAPASRSCAEGVDGVRTGFSHQAPVLADADTFCDVRYARYLF